MVATNGASSVMSTAQSQPGNLKQAQIIMKVNTRSFCSSTAKTGNRRTPRDEGLQVTLSSSALEP